MQKDHPFEIAKRAKRILDCESLRYQAACLAQDRIAAETHRINLVAAYEMLLDANYETCALMGRENLQG